MKFGFLFFHRDLGRVVEVATLAERLGFDLIGLVDSPTLAFDPYVAGALAARATERIRLGPAVTNPQTRHPLITANLAASLEALAPGRSYLGLGTGLSGVHHAGVRRASLAGLAERVRAVRALLRGETVQSDGATMALKVGNAAVPIMLAGSGPRTLRLAGQIADFVFFNLGARPEYVVDARRWIAEGAEAAGRDPEEVESWLYTPAAIAHDHARAIDEVRNGAISSTVFTLNGDLSEKRVPAELQDRVRELGRSYQYGEHLSPGQTANYHLAERLGLVDYVIQRFSLAGTPDELIQRLAELRTAGLRNVCLNLGPAPDLAATLRLFGETVLPACSSL